MQTRTDPILGGRLRLTQPEHGFRAGHDAVLLAAAAPDVKGAALELGAGAGTASLCYARRCADVSVTGVELSEEMAALAVRNTAENGLADRVSFVCGDVFDLPPALRTGFDVVLCNPPFYGPGGDLSPDPLVVQAKMDGGLLKTWMETGLKRTRSDGIFISIIGADRLSEALSALPETGVTVLPLWPKAGVAAKRVLIKVKKCAKSPFQLSAGLVLHEANGTPTSQADAILRGGAGLEI